MIALLTTLALIIFLYRWAVIAYIVMGWLIRFNVIHTSHPMVSNIYNVLHKIIEPVLAPIRQRLPLLGGIDISPIILLLALFFLETLISQDLLGAVSRG